MCSKLKAAIKALKVWVHVKRASDGEGLPVTIIEHAYTKAFSVAVVAERGRKSLIDNPVVVHVNHLASALFIALDKHYYSKTCINVLTIS